MPYNVFGCNSVSRFEREQVKKDNLELKQYKKHVQKCLKNKLKRKRK